MPFPIGSLVRPGRDLRIDFLRGLALWFIFINHTPGNLLGRATLSNFALSDASEAFVMLAGYSSGIVYGRVMEKEGWSVAAARIAGRCGTLYVAHIFLFVVFTAQVGLSVAALDAAMYLDELALDPFGQEPYRALLEALLLRYQPAFLDILPLYIVVLAIFALALPLLRWPLLLLTLSVVVYVVARWLPLGPPAWRAPGWFFNPFAWQLLFIIGAVLGRTDPATLARRFPWNPWIGALAVSLLVAVAVALNLIWHGPILEQEAPEWMAAALAVVDKTSLHPARLASMLLIAWLLAHLIPVGARWLQGQAASIFTLMGQQSLPVFCAGIFLSFFGRVAIDSSDAVAMQGVVNVLGLGALVAVGAVSAWYAGEGRQKRAQPLPARLPAG